MGELNERCGVFGIWNPDGGDVAYKTYLALYALQHRGQQGCGIAVNDRGVIRHRKQLGLVPDSFSMDELEKLGQGQIALGHVLYSHTPDVKIEEVQPLVMRYKKGNLSIVLNGCLVNARELSAELEETGAIFQSGNDAEIIAYLIARERLNCGSAEDAIRRAMQRLEGAYSLIVMSPRKMIAARDPNGFRPLSMGTLGNTRVVSSETCAFDALGVKFARDILPGEIVTFREGGPVCDTGHCSGKSSLCCFEFIYFARPDSVIAGTSVHLARKVAGRCLAKSSPVEADIVVGVPDSGLDAALGYSLESGIPYDTAYIKNRYVGRTFIQSKQEQREDSVKIKLNAIAESVNGKRIVLVDDSIVRGTTSRHIAPLLREAGAKEIHMRIASPPFLYPCYFGTDIDAREKLIANRLSLDEIRREFNVDSLAYLKPEHLGVIADCGLCAGCFTGRYPVEVREQGGNKYNEYKE